ncbi:MAG: mannonate dehydratase [Gemmatimonadaceae bacterium]|jgi:mannonate dehydratase|nr:mannonate dehydratase [Gemmatimonadaceae bacterium]
MQMTFRWFGPNDPVRLDQIRQIPGVTGIVSALHDLPVGAAWPRDAVLSLRDRVAEHGLALPVIESVPVHEDIKLGRPTRERYAEAFGQSIVSLGAAGVGVLCYNFMPIFDWTRTDLAARQPDGSTALAYDDAALAAIDLSRGTGDLPGWAAAYDAETLGALRAAYANVSPARLWEHLHWFLEYVTPIATSAGVRLALHPDDPPWPIFGLPRIVTDGDALSRVTQLVDAPANGLTFCTGSLGARADNDLPAIVQRVGARIHFVHARNVKRTGARAFHESRHPTRDGDVDMRAVFAALKTVHFDGPMRPDHGRMIWGETGRPGYGLYDRALGATYLTGLWEGLTTAS